MGDPMLGCCIALAERFGMLPSKFIQTATAEDVRNILSLDLVRDEDWRKKQAYTKSKQDTASMSPDEYTKYVRSMMTGASDG